MQPLPQRPFRDEISLSIVGFGGMVLVDMGQDDADRSVLRAIDEGINYFDVAPFYGSGEAEKTMGRALAPHREKVFLACKTLERTAEGAARELEQSLRRLRTDRFDLYQFHAVTKMSDVEAIFAEGGALELFLRARQEGKIRYIGFSAHSVEAALAMLDRFPFDSILFPFNVVCYASGRFGPQVLERARERGVARLALKAMAWTTWDKQEVRSWPKCWYRPIDDPVLARDALRFTLSEDVTAAIPPGEAELFWLAVELARDFTPLGADERRRLLDLALPTKPIFRVSYSGGQALTIEQ